MAMIPHSCRAVAAYLTMAAPVVCAAQPGADNPQTKPGGTIVVNPINEECRAGWSAEMRWTEQQFREFCERLNASK
jgi:hypothetical protein